MRLCILAAAFGGALSLHAASALAQQSVPAQSPAPAQANEQDPVVATVDGSSIHMFDLAIALEQLPPQYRNTPLQQIFGPLLQQMIQRRLVALAAEKDNIANDPQIQRRIAFARDEILAQAYMGRLVGAKVTPETVKARYEAELATAPRNEEVRARHILVGSLEEAEAVLVELRGGAEFAEVAKQRSTGPTGVKGGDLGFFAKGDMVPEFANAAFAMAPGEVSEPVKTQFGWHVIKLEERRASEPASLEERLPELRAEMERDVVEDVLEALEKTAKIEAFNPDGTPLETEPAEKKAE